MVLIHGPSRLLSVAMLLREASARTLAVLSLLWLGFSCLSPAMLEMLQTMLEAVLLCSRVFLSQLITTLNTDFNKICRFFNYFKIINDLFSFILGIFGFFFGYVCRMRMINLG